MNRTDVLVLSESGVRTVHPANEQPPELRQGGFSEWVRIWVCFVVRSNRESRWRRLLEEAMIHQQEVSFRGNLWLVDNVQTTRARLGRPEPLHTLNR